VIFNYFEALGPAVLDERNFVQHGLDIDQVVSAGPLTCPAWFHAPVFYADRWMTRRVSIAGTMKTIECYEFMNSFNDTVRTDGTRIGEVFEHRGCNVKRINELNRGIPEAFDPAKGLRQEGVTILIVDDDVVSREFLKLLLESRGYRVRLAENGKRALEVLGGEEVDLMVVEREMPFMDGIEVVKKVRRGAPDRGVVRRGQVPVIMLSGFRERELFTAFIRSGADLLLVKPVRKSDLLRAISALLDREGLFDDRFNDFRSVHA
jgi:CheY-like chemotaxis protein